MPTEEKKLPQDFLDAFEKAVGSKAKDTYDYGHSWHVDTVDGRLYRVVMNQSQAQELAEHEFKDSLDPSTMLDHFSSMELSKYIRIKTHMFGLKIDDFVKDKIEGMSETELLEKSDSGVVGGALDKYRGLLDALEIEKRSISDAETEEAETIYYTLFMEQKKKLQKFLEDTREKVRVNLYAEIKNAIAQDLVSWLINNTEYDSVEKILNAPFIIFLEESMASVYVSNAGIAKFLAPVDGKELKIDGYFVYREE